MAWESSWCVSAVYGISPITDIIATAARVGHRSYGAVAKFTFYAANAGGAWESNEHYSC